MSKSIVVSKTSMGLIFHLALETRRQIYQLLIVYPEPINQWDRAKPSDLRETHHNYSALLRSCHQIHDEVRHTFYSENVFSFKFHESPDRESITVPELRFLQIAECRVSITASTTFKGDMKRYVYNQTLCTWLAKARQIRRLQVHFKVASDPFERPPPVDQMSRITGDQDDLIQLTRLGLLGPFGQLTNVETFILEGDIPAVYRTNLLRKMQGHEPTRPLPDMYHALQLYVCSYSNPIGAYKFKDDLWQIERALMFAAAGDMKGFKRHRRVVKRLGDLRRLDSAILYAHDPKLWTRLRRTPFTENNDAVLGWS